MTTTGAISGVLANDYVGYTHQTEAEKTDSVDTTANDFNDILSNAINEMTSSIGMNTMNSMTSGLGLGTSTDMMGMSGSFFPGQFMAMPSLTDTLEQAIIHASETGDSNDAMMALLMLMMMMQSGQGEDSSMFMTMMATMISNMQNKDDLRDEFMYTSGGEPYTLDMIDRDVFGNIIPMYRTSGSSLPASLSLMGVNNYIPDISNFKGKAEMPLEFWRPTTPVITSNINTRNPQLYTAVVKQFDVENSERYRPGRDGNTYCNIFVWDVTTAMGAELPHYTNPQTGEPMYYPNVKGAKAMRAEDLDKWLKEHGEKYGWYKITSREAQMHANLGRPVVTTANHMSHVQMIVPSNDGSYDPEKGPMVAQAGRTVTEYMPLSRFYNESIVENNISFWVHA